MNQFVNNATEYIKEVLGYTAWRMYTPHVLGFVHAYSFIIVIALSVFAAAMAMRMSEKKRLRLLTGLGWVMLIMEIYKQLFYYFIVNDGAYDYWFLPFQLCSMPMYMCILLPFLKGTAKDTVLTFMAGFTFVSSLAALIYPEDMLRPYIALTAHGFIWHGILLFISLLIGLSGMADLSFKGIMRSVVLFLVLSLAAILINVVTEPLARASVIENSYPNMFYLSPFHPSGQPFIGKLESQYGRPQAMAIYIAITAGAAMVSDFLFWLISKRNRK